MLTVARMEMKLGMHECYIISMTTSSFHDDRMLFEQHQIASGNLHSSNLLMVALMEMKVGMKHCFHDNRIIIIRASVDALYRDDTSEIPRDPRTKRLKTQRE